MTHDEEKAPTETRQSHKDSWRSCPVMSEGSYPPRNATLGAGVMVARVFHRVYLDEPIPDEYEENWEKLKALHPRWGFESWERSEDLELRNRELFDSFTEFPAAYGFRADIARYELLARFGGCYVDTDVEPLRPFDELPEDQPFIAWCSEKELDPAIIGSPAHHPAIELLVDELAQVYEWKQKGKSLSPPGSTGPRYVTARWRMRPDVLRLPPIAFFPYHWSGTPYEPWPKESLAVHHWRAGWKDERGLRGQRRTAQRRAPVLAAKP